MHVTPMVEKWAGLKVDGWVNKWGVTCRLLDDHVSLQVIYARCRGIVKVLYEIC